MALAIVIRCWRHTSLTYSSFLSSETLVGQPVTAYPYPTNLHLFESVHSRGLRWWRRYRAIAILRQANPQTQPSPITKEILITRACTKGRNRARRPAALFSESCGLCFLCLLVVVANLCFFGFFGCNLAADSFKALCCFQARREVIPQKP